MTEEQAERLIEVLHGIRSDIQKQSKETDYIGVMLSEIDFHLKSM
ncbi:hypothetical protein [Salinicoccus sp. Marseille-QA3877]